MSDKNKASADGFEIVEAPYFDHWLLELVDPTPLNELTGSLRFGTTLPPFVPPLQLIISHAGQEMDFSFTARGLMIVSGRAEQLLRRVAPADLQYIPAAIGSIERAFSIANVVTTLDCVDHERSGIVPLPGPSAYSLTAPEYFIDAARVGGHQLFRLHDDELVHVMTRQLKEAIEDAQLIGPPLMPMDGSGALITPGIRTRPEAEADPVSE